MRLLLLLLLPSFSIASDFELYYGLHTVHAKLSEGKTPKKDFAKNPANNQNKLMGIRYNRLAASTYINSQKSDIRNYTLSYEFDYFGIGAVYGYDKKAITGSYVEDSDYKPTLLPMAYAKIPIYSIKTKDFEIGIKSIFMVNALNTGLSVKF